MDESVVKLIVIGVSILILGVLIVFVVSLTSTGKGLFDTGNAMLNNGVAVFNDMDKTVYDGKTSAGSEVINLIKQYWVPDNTVAITVCTLDGQNVMYDYEGSCIAQRATFTGFPKADARKVTFADASGTGLTGTVAECKNGATSVPTYDATQGYHEGASSTLGHINKSTGLFMGSIQYDQNNNIRGITFVQTK